MTTFKGLIVFFGVILTVSSLNAAELVTDGSTPTTIDQAPNGVPIVNIAGPNNSGLSHNRFQQFNVGASGLILNNANSTTASTQLGGQILGNSQLALPARVILNEVTSTNRSRLNGYTEVGGHAADIVIANPNGISVNGAGFINAPRVTLTTGIPLINGAGLLEGFNVTRGEISVEDDGLDSSAQDATSIYSHYLKLNAAVHARDLDVVLGNNAIDYPGRKASRINPASSNRVLLDSTALGGIYANKITLVGTAQGLGMNLPPEVIAATGAIEISADGRIQLQRLKAAGDIAVRSNQSIVSSDTVFGETTVALAATESITVEAGLIAASESIAISAASFDNQGTILAGVDADSDLNNHGQLEIEATTVENRGDITATRSIDVNSEGLNNRGLFHAGNRLSIKSASLTNQETLYSASDTDIEVGGGLINQGLINANNSLSITSDSLTNLDSLSSGSDLQIEVNGSLINQGLINAGDELTIAGEILDNQTTLFSSGDMALWVRDTLTNAPDASILAANNLTLAGDADLSKTDHIINDLGLIQTLQGDISVYATRFDNIGEANIDFKTFYFDIGNSEEITSVADAQTINLAYSTGFFTEIKKARLDWVVEVQRRLKLQAPDLYDANSDSIGNINILAADFIAIETRIEDYSVTRPAYLDSGGELFLHVDNFDNRNSVVAAVGNIIFDVANDYRNLAESETVSVTNYRYRTSAQHSEKTSWGKDKDKYSSEGYSGYFTVSSTQKVSANTVTQAGGSIIGTIGGNVANNGVRTGDSYQSSNSIDPRASTQTEIQIPDNNFGLFVLSQNPTSNYLIETNPQFTNFENLVNSSYLLERLDFSANETLRRLGDGFYESNLIRETVFAQTGRRYLSAKIKNDTQQFQFLMDNALLAQADLELTPGVALTKEQINRLTGDIVWLEPVIIAGESLLVPRVYLASSRDSTIQGGKIIAGESINQQIASLDNSGLLEAADDLFIDADKGIFNDGGGIVANGDIALTATDDIGNISGVIRGNNVSLHSIDGSIINRRDSTEYQLSSTRFDYSTTLTGEAGRISASNQLSLQAADEIRIEGSDLHGSQINLEADSVTITTTEIAESLYAGDHKNFHQVDANRHLVSTIVGDDIVILSNGKTELTAAQLSASNELRIEAGDIEINTVQESRFQASKSSNKSTFSSSVEENRSFRAYNQGSQLAAASIYLVTDQGDIKITGSTLVADNTIDLASAGNIRIVSGAKDSLDESYRRKSGWFSGGSLFEEAEDLEGRISQVAVNSQIHAGEIIMAAADDMELIGVDASASDSFNLAADNIIISHAVNEETQYEKHTRISVGLGDIAANLADIGNLVKTEDGQLSLSLLSADYAHATETHTQSNAVVSLIQAGNISMTATQSEPGTGDILIRGSDLIATDAITLEASGDVAILDGLHVQSSETLNRDGSMDLNLTAKNEYVQVAQSIDALRTAEDDLSQARHDYDRYREDLALQEAHLIDMQRQFADNEGYIEQSDIDDFQRQLDRMRDDGDFYQTNIALATVTLGSQTTALIQQTAKAAASSGTWGFNVGLELDVDLLEQQVNSYYQQSLASNLSANSIVIKAGNTATVRGSNLLADELIDIDASNINLLAAASHSNSDESQQQIEGSYSWDMYGGDAANAANSNSAFLAANGSSRSSETIEYVNSQLLANNIRLNANED
ncbi:MAG: filamentous hemagglutinin family protein, partial [Gammaproteobacteria bacterium]